jgi:hypothetical protein
MSEVRRPIYKVSTGQRLIDEVETPQDAGASWLR